MSLTQPAPAPARPSRTRSALGVGAGYLVVLWIIYGLQILIGPGMLRFGLHPLHPSSLPDIFTAPFLHGSLTHLLSNSLPGAVFAFLIALSGTRIFAAATLIIMVLSGLGVWLIGGVASVHIGASGLLYGWLAFLVLRGWFSRKLSHILLGLVLAASYTGWIWGVMPTQAGVSWQYHLCGAVAGVVAAWIIGRRAVITPPVTQPGALGAGAGAGFPAGGYTTTSSRYRTY